MSLNYTTYVNQLSNIMVIPSSDTNFNTFLPGCIDYAEQRIYRELDLVNEIIADTGNFSPNVRNITLPTNTGTFIVVEQINAVTPVGTTTLTGGGRSQMRPVTRDFLDAVYPSQSVATGVPQFFAPLSQDVFVVGPTPDSSYQFEVVGVQRPTALSSTNTTTILTNYVPDLFIAASMVFAAGYMRDYGAQSDDPQIAQSWEQQYGKLFQSAQTEQLRARFMGPAWTAYPPSPPSPPRV